MAAAAGPRPGLSWTASPRRRGVTPPDADRTPATPQPWVGDEQVRLARDLSVLLSAGLIVAVEDGVEDGGEVRYAVPEHVEGHDR